MSLSSKFFNVNWVNGMKIRKEHFIQQENAFDYKLKDITASFLNSYNFGLLPMWGNKDSSSRVVMKISNQKFLNISILNFNAITAGGARIEIMETNRLHDFTIDLSKEIEAGKKEESGLYYVMLTIDLFIREPFGELDADEEPPRYPYTTPKLKVNVIHENQIASDGISPFSLFIGKMLIRQDRIEISEDYIPPCMTLKSHSSLYSFHLDTEKFYNKLELDILSIISKIKEKEQDTSLALSVQVLTHNLLNFISTNNLKFRWLLFDQPPIYLFENIACFARIIRNTIDCNTSVQKEELLNYFTNWSELKQGDFEKLLVYCINFEYNHNDISISICQFSEFVQIIASLFNKLESLAYIGEKTKKIGVFVKETKVKRSFLAD